MHAVDNRFNAHHILNVLANENTEMLPETFSLLLFIAWQN